MAQRTRDAYLKNLTVYWRYGKTAGVIGTGKIGVAMLRILKGLLCVCWRLSIRIRAAVSMSICQPCSLNQTLSSALPADDRKNYYLLNEAAFQI